MMGAGRHEAAPLLSIGVPLVARSFWPACNGNPCSCCQSNRPLTPTVMSTYHIEQLDDRGSTCYVLQDFYFAQDFLLLDGLEYLNDTFRAVHHVNALKDFAVFASPNLADNLLREKDHKSQVGFARHEILPTPSKRHSSSCLIVVLITPADLELFICTVLWGGLFANVGMHSGYGWRSVLAAICL